MLHTCWGCTLSVLVGNRGSRNRARWGCALRVHVEGARWGCTLRVHVEGARWGCTLRVHVERARWGCTLRVHVEGARWGCTLRVHVGVHVHVEGARWGCTLRVHVEGARWALETEAVATLLFCRIKLLLDQRTSVLSADNRINPSVVRQANVRVTWSLWRSAWGHPPKLISKLIFW